MNFITLCLYFLLFFAVGGKPALAAGPPGGLSIEIKASKARIAIGDSLSLFCTVILPDSIQAQEPYLKDKSLFIDAEKQWMKEEKTSAGNVRHYGFLTFVLSADTLNVGPFVLEYITNTGMKGEIYSNTLELRAAGAVEKADAPPKPNHGPLKITSKGIPGWLLFLVLLALLLAAAYYFRKYSKKEVLDPVSIKPLDEIEEFERIRSLHLLENGQLKEHYLMVSLAIRGFIHRNMGFEAMYSTTYEIRRNLARKTQYREASESLLELLAESDMVKFAKYVPPVEISSTVIDRAEAPVRKTLEQMVIEKEKERLAAEENKRSQAVEASQDTDKETAPAPGGEL
jgi:hypothetical protein